MSPTIDEKEFIAIMDSMWLSIKDYLIDILKYKKLKILKGGFVVMFAAFIFIFFSYYNYLFFHSSIEILTIGVMIVIFSLAYHSKYLIQNNYFIFLGNSILFSGCLTLLHVLAFRGMSVFTGTMNNANTGTQLWIVAQFSLASSFLLAPYFIKKSIHVKNLLLIYSGITIFFIASIFYLNIFPISYIEGVGLTTFKRLSELLIILSFVGSLILLVKNRRIFDSRIFYLLATGILLMIVSELSFTVYLKTNDFFNVLGHVLRLIGFGYFYRAFVGVGLQNPYNLILRANKLNEDDLKKTSLKLLEEKIKIEALLLSISDGVIVTDNKAVITFVNKSIEEFSELRQEDLVGKELDEAMPFFDENGKRIPREERPVYKAISIKNFFSEKIIRSLEDYYLHNKKGHTIPISVRAAPYLVNGNNLGAVAILRNISKEKEIDKAKTEFVSFASHQLKTPLTTIGLSLEMLKNSDGLKKFSKEQKELLKKAHFGQKEMTEIIENLLSISKIQMGGLNINPEVLHLHAVINKILKNFTLSLEEKHLKIKKHFEKDLPFIQGDQKIMKLVLGNCLSNAIKHSPQNSSILIETKKTKREVIISISDAGEGISSGDQAKIFNKFFQSTSNQQHNGSGLGLYIAKYAISQIGGKIWYESPSSTTFLVKNKKGVEKQKGTTFFISVPLGKEDFKK